MIDYEQLGAREARTFITVSEEYYRTVLWEDPAQKLQRDALYGLGERGKVVSDLTWRVLAPGEFHPSEFHLPDTGVKFYMVIVTAWVIPKEDSDGLS